MRDWNAVLAAFTPDERAEFFARYDKGERERVEREWDAEGRYEHDCGEDVYCGGCSVCGAVT